MYLPTSDVVKLYVVEKLICDESVLLSMLNMTRYNVLHATHPEAVPPDLYPALHTFRHVPDASG
jgi:hypothetical protein